MTNAMRPILTLYDFTPPPPGCIWMYEHSALCLSTAVFLSSMYLCLFSRGLVYFYRTRANATPLKTIVQSTEGDDYMLCERQNELSRPPQSWLSRSNGDYRVCHGGGQFFPFIQNIPYCSFILHKQLLPGDCTIHVLLHFTCKQHFLLAVQGPSPRLRPNAPHTYLPEKPICCAINQFIHK